MRARSTIEASSTTRTSSAEGVLAVVAEADAARPPAEQPVDRGRLVGDGVPDRGLDGQVSLGRRITSCIRAAALPVGAARPIRSGRPAACSRSRARSRTTVVVFPVPGPARDDREAPEDRGGRGDALPIRPVSRRREQPVQPRPEARDDPRPSGRPAGAAASSSATSRS